MHDARAALAILTVQTGGLSYGLSDTQAVGLAVRRLLGRHAGSVLYRDPAAGGSWCGPAGV